MGKLGRHSNAERLEKFHKLWESMNELGVPVIVEGKRDISAIRQLGYNGDLIQLNDGKSVLNTVEGIVVSSGVSSEFVILMFAFCVFFRLFSFWFVSRIHDSA